MLEQADRERQQPIERAPRREHWDRSSNVGTALALTSPRSASGSTTAMAVETPFHFCWEPRFRVFTMRHVRAIRETSAGTRQTPEPSSRHRQELVLTFFCRFDVCQEDRKRRIRQEYPPISFPPSQTSIPLQPAPVTRDNYCEIDRLLKVTEANKSFDAWCRMRMAANG